MSSTSVDSDFRPIPTYIPVEEGISNFDDVSKCREYLEVLFDTYIKDTPFKQVHIYELHDRVRAFVPNKANFSGNTVRREMLRMRQEGLLQVFSEADRKQDRYFVWNGSNRNEITDSFNELSTSIQNVKNSFTSKGCTSSPVVVQEYVSNQRNPFFVFFMALFTKIFKGS